MKVFLKYIDKIDSCYKKISIDNKEGVNREEIVALLEMNCIDVDKHRMIRWYCRRMKGWVRLKEEDVVRVPLKIMVEIDRWYNRDVIMPKIEEMIGGIERDMGRIEGLEGDNLNKSGEGGDDGMKGIVILTSSPLKYWDKKDGSNFFNPVNYEGCLSNIVDIVKSYDVLWYYDILTKECLKETILSLSFIPLIIHIYCQGGYDQDGRFYLSFEDKAGNLINGTADDFKELIKGIKHKEPLIIISTPHSEEAGILLSEAGISNFICIHSNLINDYQERKFTKLFYESLILQETIHTAMQTVSLFIETEYKRNPLYQCCCFHKHKPDCHWKIKFIENPIKSHNDHMAYPCICEDKHITHHKKINCQWAKMFMMNYSSSPPQLDKTIKTCCCMDSLAHSKVIHLHSSFNNPALKPFETIRKRSNENMKNIISKSCFDLPFSLNVTTSLVGRNDIIYDILRIYSAVKVEKEIQCVTLNGEKHTGKRELAKYCGIYLYERGYVTDVIIVTVDKRTTVDNIKSLASKGRQSTDKDIMKFDDVLLIIIVISNYDNLTKKIIPVLHYKYPSMKCLIVNESNAISSFHHQFTLPPLQLNNITTLINELDPSINILDQTKDKYKKRIDGELTEYERFLMEETKGKFSKIFLLARLFNDKRDEKKKYIQDYKKAMQESTDSIDLSSIQSDSLKLELLYLLLFHSDGFSLNEIDYFYLPAPLETLFNMSPIVIKRTRAHGDHFQIQSLTLSKIKSSIQVPSSIKTKIKLMLITKYAIIYRYFTSLPIHNTPITSHNAQLNYGMWNQLSPPSINIITPQMTQQLQSINERLSSDLHNDFNKKALNSKTLKGFFSNEDIDHHSLKNLIEDLTITIPSLFHARQQTYALDLIKYNKELLNDLDDYEFAKGRLYLLSASVHSNIGISTAENYNKENEDIQEALRYFNIIRHYEGIAECYFFSSVNKFKCKGFIMPKEDHLYDINKAMEYCMKDKENRIGFARVAYQIAYYDLIDQRITMSNLDNLLQALEIFDMIVNCNRELWLLETMLLLSKVYFFMKEYHQASYYYTKGLKGMLMCNNENIGQSYREHEEKMRGETYNK